MPDFRGTLGQLDARYTQVFSPMAYGAAGNGTTDDTTPVLAAFTAAAAANRPVDLGSKAFLTSSAIPAYTGMRLRGTNQQGFVSSGGGTLVNNTTDLFSFSGAVADIKISDCTLKASAGHVFNAGTATIALLKLDGVVISQTATGKSIWNQTGGGLLDSVIGDNCSFYMNPLATVSPWVVTGVVGNFNSVTFRKMRCTMNGNGAVVPFFKIDPGSTAGWNEEIKFEDITWEICSGGAVAMTGAVGVTVDNCANWDIPSVRSDTGCATHTSTTVDDAAAVTGDLNKTISGTGIPAGTRITAVSAGTGYTISQAATATASGLTFIVGGLSADFYSFKTSTAGYPVRSIQVLGGRAGSGSTTGSGHNDFFADSSCTNIELHSFGSWGTAPVISSPSGQTTIINGTVASGAPTNTIPGVSPTAPDIQWHPAVGTATWTKPAGAVTTEVFVLDGGAGGGSGRRGAAATIRCGGGGGGAGALVSRKFVTADLTSTVTVTTGDGGAGGAAVTADSTSGNNGSFGGASSFGSYLSGTLGTPGVGGTATAGTGGVGPFSTAGSAGSGGSASATGGPGVGVNTGVLGPAGAPSGGGITSGDVPGAGAAGNVSNLGGGGNSSGAAGVVDTTNPTTGSSAGVKGSPGGSGGSGAASITTTAQAGASAYANSGAGGAGGGASLNGNNSGAGGKGGSGFVLAVSYFQ